MDKTTPHSTPGDKDASQVLTPTLLRYWNDLQQRYHLAGWDAVAFVPNEQEAGHWRVHLDFDRYRDAFYEEPVGKNRDGSSENDTLNWLFASDFQPSEIFWRKLQQGIYIKGVFVPTTELQRLQRKQLDPTLSWLKLKARHFSFVEWLRSVYSFSQKGTSDGPLPATAIWYYLVQYAAFLKKMSRVHPIRFRGGKPAAHHAYPSPTPFEQMYPSGQLVHLLLNGCEQYYFDKPDGGLLERYVASLHPVVQGFWATFGDLFPDFAKGRMVSRRLEEMERRFYSVFDAEKKLFGLQVLLADEPLGFWDYLPDAFRQKYNRGAYGLLANRLANLTKNSSIQERIRSSSEKATALPMPQYGPLYRSPENGLNWFDFTAGEQDELYAAAQSTMPTTPQKQWQSAASEKIQQHAHNLLNHCLAPFIICRKAAKGPILQWNIFPPNRAAALAQQFETNRQKERKEEDRLRAALETLYATHNGHKLRKLKKKTPEFAFSHLQERWVNALHDQRQTIDNQRQYRIRRMKEFGILSENEKSTETTEALLDEMLQVEKEVTPYILFVKRAFRTALPMRKTTRFNPYRHSHDGIEFDPQTIQNQNKWLRGEVMKTLQVSTDKGDAEQINAIVLDASGSMDHERMRQLFKILYLLVLGLEDRKTYDAIHFFSTGFMPTAGFTEQYTTRRLMYKVLKGISFVSRKDGVVYGGVGGTNISAGVRGCYEQVMEFSEKLKAKNPESLHLKSIFVLTDGRPSLGILDIEELGNFIQSKREEGNMAIKGIYLKPPTEELPFMELVFGKDQYVESEDFGEAVQRFVYIMTATYRGQRG